MAGRWEAAWCSGKGGGPVAAVGEALGQGFPVAGGRGEGGIITCWRLRGTPAGDKLAREIKRGNYAVKLL